MTLQQPSMVHHTFPWWLELVGAAIIGAAVLFGVLLAADQVSFTSTQTGPTAGSWITQELQVHRATEVLGQ